MIKTNPIKSVHYLESHDASEKRTDTYLTLITQLVFGLGLRTILNKKIGIKRLFTYYYTLIVNQGDRNVRSDFSSCKKEQ